MANVYFPRRNCGPASAEILLIVFVKLVVPVRAQKFGGIALTPPMGWNSWNKFGPNINEQMIREMADAMISSHEGCRLRVHKYR